MAENSKISWTDHTTNFWMGCMKVNEACKFCYAETFANRYFGKNLWGPGSDRHVTKNAWVDPLKWNKQAGEMGVKYRVFASSLSDFFEDNEKINDVRIRAWDIIRQTKNLTWLILTKRPENIKRFLPEDWGEGWDNVMLGCSVGQDSHKKLAEELIKVPAQGRFISAEPLIDYPDLQKVLKTGLINWVIVGGESGLKKYARPFNIQWARRIKKDCEEYGVKFFMKQLGSNPVYPSQASLKLIQYQLPPRDFKGDDINVFPEDLKVQEFYL